MRERRSLTQCDIKLFCRRIKMLTNKKTRRNLIIELTAAAVLVMFFISPAMAKKGGNGGGKPGGGDGGPVGTGTIYYTSGDNTNGYDTWSMNPDGSGKTPVLAGEGDASIALHPDEGDRWFLQFQNVDGFYPATAFEPEYWWPWSYQNDLNTVSFTGDLEPESAWGTINYIIIIDSTGNADTGEPDTFRWYALSYTWPLFDGQHETPETPDTFGIPITGLEQTIEIGSTVLTFKFDSTTGHAFNDSWAINVVKSRRSGLFAVSADGLTSVQLTDDPTVQPLELEGPDSALFPPELRGPQARWAYDGTVVDGKVSYLAKRWGKDAMDNDVVTEKGLFVTQVEWDPQGEPYALSTPTILPVSASVDIEMYDWSPDGAQIVYTVWDAVNEVGDVYIGDAVEASWLCQGEGAVWSPLLEDGISSLIAFAGTANDIRTISPDGTLETMIVPADSRFIISGDTIQWSPEGTHLIYTLLQSKGRSVAYDVVRVGADGSGSANLTKDVKEKCYSLSWR